MAENEKKIRFGDRLMSIRINKNAWLEKSAEERERICDKVCATFRSWERDEYPEVPIKALTVQQPVTEEVLRWTDGTTICEQEVWVDEHGFIVWYGPIMCQPV